MAAETEGTTTRIVAQMKISTHEGKKAPTGLITSALKAFEHFAASAEDGLRHVEIRSEYDYKVDHTVIAIVLIEAEPKAE